MPDASNDAASARALAAATCFQQAIFAGLGRNATLSTRPSGPPNEKTASRLQQHFSKPDKERGTVLYLAYGSNLSSEKFRSDRGIKPLSQVNVQVPSLRLTFDLPGIPYIEPCFANSGKRSPEDDSSTIRGGQGEKSSTSDILVQKSPYRKDAWHKGLIGVVYEVTPEDYAHIIATEGGGSGYQDILVDCHPLPSSDPKAPVANNPTLPPFQAHTLFAPVPLPEDDPPTDGGRFHRHDPSYAQPSARYLKLITDGADELNLPYEYQDYLHSIRPFTITTMRQRLGQFVLLSTWGPILTLVIALGKIFADKNGLLPVWLRELTSLVFRGIWISYDSFFKPVFGEGERSIPDGGDDLGWRVCKLRKWLHISDQCAYSDLEKTGPSP